MFLIYIPFNIFNFVIACKMHVCHDFLLTKGVQNMM